MQQVRCTNCGSAAIIPDESGEFCKCEACGSTFNVPKASAFSKVQLDHTQDVRAWREYLAKQLRLQQESNKSRDYGGVKLFAQKILSVLPDDFCAMYYAALAERFSDNDTAFFDFLHNVSLDGTTDDERREVVDSLVLNVEPKYLDDVKAFIDRALPDRADNYAASLERNIKNYIQRLRHAKVEGRDVFICHRTAAPDQDIADAICTRLEERGLRCWIAPRNILAGSQNYERDIIKGVENCRIFLVVTSFKSIYSEDCEMELKAAVLADKALYSYRIDDTEYDGAFKKALASVQWLDATDDPYAHLEQLVIDIKSMLAEDEREKAELEEKRLAARESERRIAEAQRAKEKERIDRLERIVAAGGVAASSAPTYSHKARLKRAEIEVTSGRFDRAEGIIDEVLDIDPENPLCWWLLLLCTYRVTSEAALAALDVDFTVDVNYKNAERFADADIQRRMDVALEGYRIRAVKAVDEQLTVAEKQFDIEEYNGMQKTLDGCKSAFSDESGLLFSKFPDIASKYYWLRLWAKYGQSPLVCVEDITRETEYKQAMRYASPSQAASYARARDIVAKNAQMFLRERSKNRSNDGKLVDYLVDNRGILPAETYNYYSSLLYYRKMLSQLNMSEQQLKNSVADISTNEYFMLAQSLATGEQKAQYDALLELLDNNREKKSNSEKAERERTVKEHMESDARAKATKNARISAMIVLMIAATVMYVVAWSIGDHNSLRAATVCFIIAAGLRIAADIAVLSCSENKKGIMISIANLVLGIVSFATFFKDHNIFNVSTGLAIAFIAVTAAAMTLEAYIIVKMGKKQQ